LAASHARRSAACCAAGPIGAGASWLSPDREHGRDDRSTQLDVDHFEPVQLSGRMSRDILQALADFLKFRLSPLQVTADVSDQVRFVRRQNQVSVAEREGVHVAFLAPLVARCRRCHSDDRFGFRTGPGE
jgi:hypothetical protein